MTHDELLPWSSYDWTAEMQLTKIDLDWDMKTMNNKTLVGVQPSQTCASATGLFQDPSFFNVCFYKFNWGHNCSAVAVGKLCQLICVLQKEFATTRCPVVPLACSGIGAHSYFLEALNVFTSPQSFANDLCVIQTMSLHHELLTHSLP